MAQLSDDGHWFWDGSEWQAARLSPDGKWHWDGGRWLPVPPRPSAAAGPDTAGPPAGRDDHPGVELDDRRFALGKAPDAVGQLPGEAIVRLAYVAIGWGWVARRVVRWHVCQFDHVQSVALVAPAEAGEPGGTNPSAAPLPQLVLRDFFGRVLRIEILQMSPLARKELLSQVPMSATVTPAAELFLEHGELPGEWGRVLDTLGPS